MEEAMAAHLAMGFTVNLFNRTPDHVEIIKKRGGIELESVEGGPHGFGELALVTSNISEAIKKMEVIMVVLPSSAHRDMRHQPSEKRANRDLHQAYLRRNCQVMLRVAAKRT
jgi:opine dehydrogenase